MIVRVEPSDCEKIDRNDLPSTSRISLGIWKFVFMLGVLIGLSMAFSGEPGFGIVMTVICFSAIGIAELIESTFIKRLKRRVSSEGVDVIQILDESYDGQKLLQQIEFEPSSITSVSAETSTTSFGLVGIGGGVKITISAQGLETPILVICRKHELKPLIKYLKATTPSLQAA